MAKRLNVNLAFTADASQAKQVVLDLQKTLNKISFDGSKGISPDLEKASQAAKELQIHLNNAFNAKTGRFDLSMLDKSLNASNTSVANLATNLLSAGNSGKQAFLQLAQAISMADQPLLKINAKIKEFSTTMANTVRWQLSSSLLHGFMSGMQGAYGYAKDLNKSLTDIRIVTGASSDEMALFAEQANKAAKALSTTTTDYTRASLIYFQQGLSDAEVEARTNATIKMANATGVTAQTVSDQMTAVWNNFYDGSKSLEYYADVMTALGAATASSTDEIADGLQKFASVADTVGLSYEYATAALATVTSETRESADVVGTAFKTLFARIQGLSLGETLEDGVDLNKYSEALASIGVNVLYANGNIKEMDLILDELGSKWVTLTDAQKQATAQTVAGVRQYTQLMALMENWETFQGNLEVARGSEGTLTEQAEIYEESWKAASKRVKASMEGIYQSGLDDQFFISINNGFANLLTGVIAFIEGAGGVKTLLIGIGSIIMSNFANKIPQALSDLSYNFKILTKGAGEAYAKIQADMNKATQQAFDEYKINPESAMGTAIKSANDLAAARSKLALVSDKLSTSERQIHEMTLSHIQTQQQELVALKQKNEALQDSIALTAEYMQSGSGTPWDDSMDQTSKARASNFTKKVTDPDGEQVFSTDVLEKQLSDLDEFATTITTSINDKIAKALASPETKNAGVQLTNTFADMKKILDEGINWNSFKDGVTNIDNVKSQIKAFIELIPVGAREALGLNNILKNMDKASNFDELHKQAEKLATALDNPIIASGKLVSSLRGIGKGKEVVQLAREVKEYDKGVEQAEQDTRSLSKLLNSFNPAHIVRATEALGSLASLAGSVYSVMRSVQSLTDSWSNPDLSGWEKFGTTLMSISMLVPAITSAMRSYGTIIAWIRGLNTAEMLAVKAVNAEKNKSILIDILSTEIGEEELELEREKHLAEIANIVAIERENGATKEAIAAKVAEYLTTNQVVTAEAAETISRTAATAAIKLKTASLWSLIRALLVSKATLGSFILAFAGVAIAVGGLLAQINELIVTQKEANEAIDTATENYAKEAEELDGLKNELSEVINLIDELNSKDSLSLVEQSELADLEKRKALLEQQVALQEQLAKDAQKTQAEEIAKNWDRAKDLNQQSSSARLIQINDNNTVSGRPSTYGGLDSGDYVQQTLDEYAWAKGFDLSKMEFKADTDLTNDEKIEVLETIENWQAEIESNQARWRQDNAEQYQKNEDNYAALIAAASSGVYNLSEEAKIKMQEDLQEQRVLMYGDNYDDTFIKPTLDSVENMTVTKSTDGSYVAKTEISRDTLDARGLNQEQVDQYISNALNNNSDAVDTLAKISDFNFNKLSGNQLFTLLDNLENFNFEGSSMEELIQYIDGIQAAAEKVIPAFDSAAWQNSYSKKQEIVGDLSTGETISAEDYALLGEEYKQYFTLQSDGTATLIAKASELKDAIHAIEIDKLEDSIRERQDTQEKTEVAKGMLSAYNAGSSSYSQPWLDEYMNKVNEEYGQEFTSYEDAIAYMEQQNVLLEEEQRLRALNSQSLGELNDLLTQGLITAEQYSNATETVFTNEVQSEGFNLEEMQDYTDALIESKEALVETREEAQRLALAHAKMERGIDSLVDNWDSWNEAMKTGNEREQIAVMGSLRKTMSDIIGVDIDQISDDFLTNTEAMKLMEKAAKGDMEALDALSALFAKKYIVEVDINNNKFQGDLDTLQSDLTNMLTQFQMEDIEIGTSLDTSGYAKAMTEMMAAAGTDIETINNILAGMGFEPEVTYVKIPVEEYSTMRTEGNTKWTDSEGNEYTAVLDTTLTADQDGMVQVPVINGSKTTFKGSGSSAASGSAKKGGKSKKGGGGSKPKQTSEAQKKKGDVVDRYKEINDKLEETGRLLEKNNIEADSLWGAKRIAALKNGVKLLEQENKQLKEKYELSKAYLKEDADALHQAAVDAGISFTIDNASGTIINYTDAMTQLFNERERLLSSFGSTMTESEEERLTAFDDKIEKVKEAYEQYEKTLDEKQDLEQEQIEKVAEIQQQYYDILSEELEIKITINDDDLELLDYHLGKIEDDFYNMAEAAALMIDSSNSLGMSQMDIYSNNLANYSDHLKRLEEDYAAGKISQADYVQGLQDTQDGIISNLESLNDLDDAMMEYYGNTLSMAIEEIAKYTDQMDHLVSILDHYQSLMEIMGKENNYAAIGVVLEGRAKLLEDQVAASKSTMKMLRGEVTDRYQAYQEALESGNDAAAEIYLKQYEDALAAANEAEDEFLSKAEEWAESLKAVLENKLKGLNKTLEEALTGGTSFDSLNTAMERAKSLQEEYLTTTNKIYETNKLMRKAQQEIDKTTNSVAKKRLQEFITETNQLQDKAKLSKFELDIQQAKYDLLLAEIALQEAQNAKSTVRLQRDSEGNFGYVYTADETLVAEAEQTLLDKQNELYNLSLNGANEYKEKYLQTLNEMYDTLADLQQQKMDGMFASEEEYQQAVAEATQFYYEQLEQYADLHGIAIVTDGRVINEAWSADFADMIQNTSAWKIAVDGYLVGAEEAFNQWAEGIGKVAETVGIPLDQIGNGVEDIADGFSKLKDEVNNVTDESTQLKDALVGKGGVIDTVQSEITAVKSITEKYANLREELGRVKKSYEDLMATINATIKAQANLTNASTPSASKGNSGTTSSSGKGNTNQSGSSTGDNGSSEDGNPDPEPKGTKVTIKVSKNPHVDGSAGTMTFKNKVDRYWNNKGTQLPYSFKLDGQEYYISANSHKKLSDVGFDTGGYTGQWGPSGKWAMLHEKELVLNKKDTENFLASMDILDKIVSVIDLHSANAQLGGLLSTPQYSGFKDNQVLEQNVRIEASFPNATNHSEIEEAFNNLINTASQYANRK